ncbi:MAG: hypothetical protein HYX59_01460 [Elusimicrobia bacterium]|nr:hypothetical protein [Elusimicrobiota bacterium]
MNTTISKRFENIRNEEHRLLAEELPKIARQMGARGMLYSGIHIKQAYKAHEGTIRGLARRLVESYEAYHKETRRPVDQGVVSEGKGAVKQVLEQECSRARQSLMSLCKTLNSGGTVEREIAKNLEDLSASLLQESGRAFEAWHEVERDKLLPPEQEGQIRNRIFVIMAIGRPDINLFYSKVVKPAAAAHGFDARPVDLTEGFEGITDRALTLIGQSKFVICDLTYERPNCYYEAGYARGKGVLPIMTARKDHDPRALGRTEGQPKVHFDLDQQNITFWDEADSERSLTALKERIRLALELPVSPDGNADTDEVVHPEALVNPFSKLDVVVLQRQENDSKIGVFRSRSSHQVGVEPLRPVQVKIDNATERRLRTLAGRHFAHDTRLPGSEISSEPDLAHHCFGIRSDEFNIHRKWIVTANGGILFTATLGRTSENDQSIEAIGDIIFDAIATFRLAHQWLSDAGYQGAVQVVNKIVWPNVKLLALEPPDVEDIRGDLSSYDQIPGVRFNEQQPEDRPAVGYASRVVPISKLIAPVEVLADAYGGFLRSTRKAAITTERWHEMIARVAEAHNASLAKTA